MRLPSTDSEKLEVAFEISFAPTVTDCEPVIFSSRFAPTVTSWFAPTSSFSLLPTLRFMFTVTRVQVPCPVLGDGPELEDVCSREGRRIECADPGRSRARSTERDERGVRVRAHLELDLHDVLVGGSRNERGEAPKLRQAHRRHDDGAGVPEFDFDRQRVRERGHIERAIDRLHLPGMNAIGHVEIDERSGPHGSTNAEKSGND